MEQLGPGLRRWTAWHDHWEEEVGAIAVDTADGLVLVDPIDPPDELRRPAHVLVTVFWHGRSTKELPGRVWAGSRSARPLENRGVTVSEIVRLDGELAENRLPGGIRAFQTARPSELVYWLPEHEALVVGDVLLGAGAKPRATDEPLRFCPERWLGKATHADLRESLRPLLGLPVEHVLVSHGTPVVGGGRRALENVLD